MLIQGAITCKPNYMEYRLLGLYTQMLRGQSSSLSFYGKMKKQKKKIVSQRKSC